MPNKFIPRAVLEWADGFNAPPHIYAVADSDEEADIIEHILEPLRRRNGAAAKDDSGV